MASFYTKDFLPKFSWSMKRDRLMNECELCYGLSYYAQFGGWNEESDALAKAAYRMKNSNSLRLYYFTQLTDVIKKLLNSQNQQAQEDIPFSTPELMVNHLREQLNKAFIQSTEMREQWKVKPKGISMIRELLDCDTLDPGLTKEVTTLMDIHVNNFFKSKTYKEAIEEKIVDVVLPNPFSFMNLPEYPHLKAYISFPAILKNKLNNRITFVSFKSTDTKSDDFQLGTALLFLKHTLQIEGVDEVYFREEWLESGRSIDRRIDPELMELAKLSIAHSVNAMSEYVVNRDLSLNKPIPIKDFKRNFEHQEDSSDNCSFDNGEHAYCRQVQKELLRNRTF